MNIKTFCRRADDVARLMKTLANPHRLMIVCRLREGPCCVGALQDIVGLQQSALSQHLARLRRDGLVKTRRDAQTITYSLADARTAKLMQTLFALYCDKGASL
jgi:DNA-binding transcriptional ArsR family regulator